MGNKLFRPFYLGGILQRYLKQSKNPTFMSLEWFMQHDCSVVIARDVKSIQPNEYRLCVVFHNVTWNDIKRLNRITMSTINRIITVVLIIYYTYDDNWVN